jgi:predicted ArsR family transcriptional regulator
MDAIDYRNACFADLKARLVDMRLEVLSHLRRIGPCTTQELADKSGISVLNVRPRVNELVELGFAEVVKDDTVIEAARLRGYTKGGVYQALSEGEAWKVFQERSRRANKETQGSLF